MSDLYHDPIFYLITNSWEKGLTDSEVLEKIESSSLFGAAELMVLKSWYIALGKGVEKNPALAIRILDSDAVNSSAIALCAIGRGYLRGYYGRKDIAKAIFFYEKSESYCSRKGSYLKGLYYFNDFLKNNENLVSFEKAGYFFKKSASNGHATSLKMYIFCSSKYRALRFIKYCGLFFVYMKNRRFIGGPERWWCYRDLELYRPATTIALAENCGHALGYFKRK